MSIVVHWIRRHRRATVLLIITVMVVLHLKLWGMKQGDLESNSAIYVGIHNDHTSSAPSGSVDSKLNSQDPAPSQSIIKESVYPVPANRGTSFSKPAQTNPVSSAPTDVLSVFNFTPPFHTKGRHILDANGTTLILASINWYGASDINFVPGGLDVQHRDDIAQLIRRLGFNSVRLSYADEIVRDDPAVDETKIAANPDLVQKSPSIPVRALDVFHAVVKSLTDAGLLVIINNHITQATWCCGANPCDAGWSNEWFLGILFCRVSQSEEEWIENWETVMQPLVSNPLVLGADLRNEVRGVWGTMHWEVWALAAEKASERLLALNPDWLMIVEGISSANDLTGVRRRPVQLSVPDRVVYSVHVYQWSGWGDLYPYSRRTYDEFAAAMRKNWGYLIEEELAPVWVGEVGTPDEPTVGDTNYWQHLVQYLGEVGTGWGYWALNARKATGERESYGLVGEEWNWASVRWTHPAFALVRVR
ncbi:hypothetical protein N7532_007727 [Penicillium argentinense]|uniref:Glycoside hydrolase family 5 domain-containing protein n=1 Tax=Penicillium argentinense TaxID=1131581 RepID=A0A9W9EW03_9EURO|nr:uncharacterized protein N7532_007727 [Penicillium argentinense]KAJ5089043.1 hypothetical protein N7532_007727 [Penicillium argentinense]